MERLQVRETRQASLDAIPEELAPGIVHLWQRSLEATAGDLAACYELLLADEREKAQRYRIERPRSDYVLTRGTLRSLLSHYLQKSPQEIFFEYGEQGKPRLTGGCDLDFNVSHSNGMALMGFVKRREIGVDVERMRPQSDALKLAERFFSISEREQLRKLADDELTAAFFRCWTRKEAYIKARGEGLSLPLHQFDVSVEAGSQQALLATRPDAAEAGRWTLCDIPSIPGYVAALAVENQD